MVADRSADIVIRLLAGADRSAIRLILERDGRIYESLLVSPPVERQELALMNSFLETQGVSWSEINEYAALILPWHRTSGRVIVTLLSAAAWKEGKPMFAVELPELAQEKAEVIVHKLATERVILK